MKKQDGRKRINFELFLLLLVIIALPFTVHFAVIRTGLEQFPWIPMEMGERGDFFLLWKSRLFAGCTGIMLLVLMDAFLIRGKRKSLGKKWIPLFIYELLAVVSTCLSKYREYSLQGMMEHFETIWVLLGYGILVYYAYFVLQEERDFQIIMAGLVAVLCMEVVIGLFQMIGFDLLQTDFVRRLLLAGNDAISKEQLLFNFAGETYQRVYGTFYNPNYAGVWFVMLLPVAYIALQRAGKKGKIGLVLLTVADLICVVGTGSKSAVIALVVIILLWSIYKGLQDFHKIWHGCIALAVLFFVFITYDRLSGNETLKRLAEGFSLSVSDYALQEITVQEDCIELQFRGRQISFFYKEEGEALYPVFLDENDNMIEYVSNEQEQSCTLSGQEFEGLVFQCYRKNEIPYIAMEYEGLKWRFTNWTEDGSYQYITIWGKPDKIEQADSVLFKGKERLFTNRGYIWSRTIPLLKKYLLWGSGPDTFLLIFPQNDYVMRANLGYGFFTEILTKPHNMYLQIGLQTGVLSVVCFLILLMGYLAESIELYYSKKSRQNTIMGRRQMDLGVGIFLAVFAYGIMGITNDSMLVTAPYFWILLGMGIKWNYLQKPENK